LIQERISRHPDAQDSLVVDELEVIAELIELEPKHYNAWSHRLFLFNTFKLPINGELEFTKKFIDLDVRNNSAWSYRRQLLMSDSSAGDIGADEMEFVIAKISLAPSNESPWVYLRSFNGWFPCDRIFGLCLQVIHSARENGMSLQFVRDAVDTLILYYQNMEEHEPAIFWQNALIEADTTRVNLLKFRLQKYVENSHIS